ncbi:hypothetical protein I302_105377 [Kwoniella bestiolae CBS 10118]|uniref:Uncharacterized protein n=1 Tax=Kwoniella bestiolae CBS 10118 TaxID=1296100 RepID=A0A1B9FT00_9TREE|nr:hypothetical protein I302_08659 [Kwoniella bestiolae CBS 10118]OCF21880.1 hypothetical protein I302_08659 [Kwoniella bestiolae CBS 10118]
MLGYYSLARRRSSNNNSSQNNPASPSLPLNSSSIYESDPPIHSSPSSKIPTSPPADRQLASDNLGSPFSITNPIYPFQPQHSSNSKSSLPTLSEHGDSHRDRGDMLTSGGSRAPLLARDFGMSGSSRQVQDASGISGSDGNHKDEEHTTSDSFSLLPGDDTSLPKSSVDLPSQRELHSKSSNLADDPNLLPPISVHDKYVSNHIQPLSSPSTLEARPSMTRATSAPGHPSHSATSPPSDTKGLLPSAIPSGESASNVQSAQESNQPIYEIFNANLSKDGISMSKNLRGYLEIVLKGQEQLGKMHLGLEGLGMGENGIWQVDREDNKGEGEVKSKIEERQKGIEDIMQRLGEISDTLRNYHQLGTPKLTFPRQLPINPKSPRTPSTTNLGRATTIAGSHPTQSQNKSPSPTTELHQTRNKPRAPSLVRSNTGPGELSPRSLMKDKARPRSPLINTFTNMDASSSDELVDERRKENSNLSPERLDDKSPTRAFPVSPPYKGGMKVPFLDMNRLEEANGHQHIHGEEDRTHHWFGESPDSKSSKRERKITDSPVEMTFKSRF